MNYNDSQDAPRSDQRIPGSQLFMTQRVELRGVFGDSRFVQGDIGHIVGYQEHGRLLIIDLEDGGTVKVNPHQVRSKPK